MNNRTITSKAALECYKDELKDFYRHTQSNLDKFYWKNINVNAPLYIEKELIQLLEVLVDTDKMKLSNNLTNQEVMTWWKNEENNFYM